jgi:hypothetical protein
MSALFLVMVEAALSATPGSSSTPTSPRSAGAHTAVFLSYVKPETDLRRPLLGIFSNSRTVSS